MNFAQTLKGFGLVAVAGAFFAVTPLMTACTTETETVVVKDTDSVVVVPPTDTAHAFDSIECLNKISTGKYALDVEITASCALPADSTYHLTGLTSVKTGATLTIGAGATFKGRADGAITALIIERGGKINAVGTSTKPIVFTSGRSAQQRGDFGGIVILGSAPMNAAGGTGEIEGLVGVPYGGTNVADSSGELKFVRIEYAGRVLGTNNELNGLTMGGVGNKTKISYVQVYEGLDDGFEWFGGTVSASHLVVFGADDDLFDWDAGWNGNLQFALGVHNLSVNSDANGIEADNKDGLEEALPRSNPKVANITLIGNGSTSLNGMRLRRGTAAQISNALVTGFRAGRAVRIDGNTSIRLVNNDSLKGYGIYAYANGGRTNVVAAAGLADSVNTVAATTTKLLTWFTGADTVSAGVNINTWRPTITPAGSVATPAGMTTANYIGAFDPAVAVGSMWTVGWARGI